MASTAALSTTAPLAMPAVSRHAVATFRMGYAVPLVADRLLDYAGHEWDRIQARVTILVDDGGVEVQDLGVELQEFRPGSVATTDTLNEFDVSRTRRRGDLVTLFFASSPILGMPPLLQRMTVNLKSAAVRIVRHDAAVVDLAGDVRGSGELLRPSI